MQGIKTIFIDQMPTYLVSKKVHFMLASKFSTVFQPCSLAVLKKDKAKFKVALRQYLNTYTIYFVDEFFVYENDLYDCFVKC